MQDVLLLVTDSWHRAIDNSKFTAAAFLDISKPFDCVNHDVLLSKLACYGVLEHSLVWLASYLSCHKHRVCMQGLSSMWGGIHVGALQGSILGPLLFSIYMNDLLNVVQICELNLYADDMEMHCNDANLASTECDLQQDIQSVNLCLCVNLLTLNIRKSNIMLIGSCQKLRNHDLCISVDGKQLSRVSSVKYLGLHIDENLSWHQHTANVVQRVYSRIHCLNHLCPMPIELLAKLYLVFVLHILDYCDVVWTPSSVQHFKCLERLHSRFNSPPSSTDFSACLTLAEQRRYPIQVYRVLLFECYISLCC